MALSGIEGDCEIEIISRIEPYVSQIVGVRTHERALSILIPPNHPGGVALI